MQPGAPIELFAGMVALPLPVADVADADAATRWRLKLLRERNVEVPVNVIEGKLWIRISAQVYNEVSDYDILASVRVRG